MEIAILSLLAIFAAIYLIKHPLKDKGGKPTETKTKITQGSLVLLGIFGLLSRSFLIVDANEVGHLKRIFLADDLPPGQIIALQGEKGPQAEILGPGFHFRGLVRILYDIEYSSVVEIHEGQYGLLLAKDGNPLKTDEFLASAWKEGDSKNMLNANYFLTEGNGQKGPQLEVLRPGKYRINQYLFSVEAKHALDVPTGHVAVIRSNVQTVDDCSVTTDVEGATGANVATPIVPKGCIGVWDEPLPPGRYYLNEKAYVSTIIPTRLQTWSYKGGYTQRTIHLTVDDNGKIQQEEKQEVIKVPGESADKAINVRVEGWTVPVDMRVVVQVHPKDAPVVVASIGDLQRVEDNIITPAIRDILRTIGGNPKRKVMDFVERRDEITAEVEQAIAIEGRKAGVTIQEVRMGEPAIPPELLVATLRQQLATQLRSTYQEEKAAQKERISVERERATADQQKILVAAEIAKKAADFKKDQLRLEGEGEKLKLTEIARGQKAQADVLGKDRALQLQALTLALEAAIQNPSIVKVPTVLVSSEGSSLEGAAAILGASTLVNGINGSKIKNGK
ncbi:MAG: SPFH domain-containing protein [Gammaproteobacteria bacterium]|nr:SPFH domain-containing protein [Gammaproteobacteria bacterium]